LPKTPGRYDATANASSVTEEEPSSNLQAAEAVDGEVSEEAPRGRVAWAAAFSGPLPPPDALAAYDRVQPGLAREIVEQWKAETAHRHRTVDGLRAIDEQSMTSYYEGEKRGQWLAFVVFLAILAVTAAGIVLDQPAVGVAAIVTGGASGIWAMRRRSDGPVQVIDLADPEAQLKTGSERT
jgi:uncharacterized membrane protein